MQKKNEVNMLPFSANYLGQERIYYKEKDYYFSCGKTAGNPKRARYMGYRPGVMPRWLDIDRDGVEVHKFAKKERSIEVDIQPS